MSIEQKLESIKKRLKGHNRFARFAEIGPGKPAGQYPTHQPNDLEQSYWRDHELEII